MRYLLFILLFTFTGFNLSSEEKAELKLSYSILENQECKWIKQLDRYKDFEGIIYSEGLGWDFYPVLNKIFFDRNSSEIPSRYFIFDNQEQKRGFTDTTIYGNAIKKYYQCLNIIAFRLLKYPNSKITLTGYIDGVVEKDIKLAKSRAQTVVIYLTKFWGIEKKRIIIKAKKSKISKDARKDSLLLEEMRRVEFHSKEFEIVKPIFELKTVLKPYADSLLFQISNAQENEKIREQSIEIRCDNIFWRRLKIPIGDSIASWDFKDYDNEWIAPDIDESYITFQFIQELKNSASIKSEKIKIPVKFDYACHKGTISIYDSTDENYKLFLFDYKNSKIDKHNMRLFNDYIKNRIKETTVINALGYSDKIEEKYYQDEIKNDRAKKIVKLIHKTKKKYRILRAESSKKKLYSNDTPEGRCYNRTVRIHIKTPLSDA